MAEQKEESVEALFEKLDKAESKSLLKKYLTKEVFDKLKDKKTKQGCDFASCIKSGVDNLDSGIGVYASDGMITFIHPHPTYIPSYMCLHS